MRTILSWAFATVFLTASFGQGSFEVVDSGSWTKRSYSVNGKWQLLRSGTGQLVIRFDDDFRTKRAPDLKLFLSTTDHEKLNSENALTSAVVISPLESNSGGQEYTLPSDIELDELRTIFIHCEQYEVLWAVSPFNPKF